MKIGNYALVADKTAFQTLYEGGGILVRPDDGRTYVKWSNSWEVLCDDGGLRVIDGSDIEVLEEDGAYSKHDFVMQSLRDPPKRGKK